MNAQQRAKERQTKEIQYYINKGFEVLEGKHCKILHHSEEITSIVYAGNSAKMLYYYRFRNVQQLESFIDNTFNQLERRGEANEAAKQAKRQANKETSAADYYKVGDIIVSTWGYEQTNTDFYVVQRITSKTIEVRACAEIRENYVSHGMACDVLPDPAHVYGEPFKLIVRAAGKLASGDNYKYFRKWDGRAQYKSWYY